MKNQALFSEKIKLDVSSEAEDSYEKSSLIFSLKDKVKN